MRAVETTPAASLNAGASDELSSGLVWPVSLVLPVALVPLVHLVRLVYLVSLVSLVRLLGFPVRPTRQTK